MVLVFGTTFIEGAHGRIFHCCKDSATSQTDYHCGIDLLMRVAPFDPQ
jgi:hypothetical protein